MLDHLREPLRLISLLKYCLVIVSSYSFIDASTGDYQEEEVYLEEEEENFDQYTNQGKLIFLQSAKPLGQGTMFLIFDYENPSQVFTLQVVTCFLKELLL